MGPRSTTLPSAHTESARELRRAFFCEMCSKGYARINEFEAHENSYDHQHRKRLKEMKALTRNPTAAVRDNRAEKKRKENSEMLSVNLQTSDGARPSNPVGFRDATRGKAVVTQGADVGKGFPSDGAGVGAKDGLKKEEVEEREIKTMRPPMWEELDNFYTLVDASRLPEEMQDKPHTLPWGRIWDDKEEMDKLVAAVTAEIDQLEGGQAKQDLKRVWDDMSQDSDFDDLDSESGD